MDTYTAASPSRGEHRYFLAPAARELRNTTGESGAGLGWKIDSRAAGGAIIAAGSVRRIEGKPRLYRVVRDVDPVALPPWLVTALTPAPAPVSHRSGCPAAAAGSTPTWPPRSPRLLTGPAPIRPPRRHHRPLVARPPAPPPVRLTPTRGRIRCVEIRANGHV
ncbi:MAG: bifunctional DNA primase/polymerase [Actinobacteria bacterium]|nr:bifunctional DNA primase/polymerase [Actinomycetota bacterium]